MKICPFCKNNVPVETEKCHHCNRILFERVAVDHATEKLHHPDEIRNDSISRRNMNFKLWAPFLALLCLIIFVSQQKKDILPYTPAVSVIPTATQSDNEMAMPAAKDPRDYNSLPSGKVFTKNSLYLKGKGELTIDNGTDSDTITKLVSRITNKSILTVYIRANDTYTINNISDGTYKLLFNLGNDWNESNNAFNVNSSYQVFDDDFDFSTTTTEEGDYLNTEYSTFKITLNPVVGGQATTSSLESQNFAIY